MSNPKVLISRALPLPPVTIGDQTVEFVNLADKNSDPNGAKAYLATFLDPVDKALIQSLPKTIGLIANFGIGVDHIDLEAAKAHDIIVTNTPVVTEDTADLAFALILAACRQTGINERFARAGQWSHTNPLAMMGKKVHGSTLGFVGFGAIGQAVARRAIGFNMKLLYWNRSAKPEAEQALGAKRIDDLNELLRQSDIVSLHTPLTAETHHIIGGDELAMMKPGSVIINTGRGPLIDEAALVKALQSDHLFGAGLDVFENEPVIHPELLKMDHVALYPHIGSATDTCRNEMTQRTLSNIVSFLQSGKALDIVV